MINVPNPLTGKEDFWKLNPGFIDLFEQLYNQDKSKDKSKSSKIMWAFYHKVHPDSMYYNLPGKDELIKVKFLKEPEFVWANYEDEELMFIDAVLTQAERSLYEWNSLMKKRDKYLKNMDYYFDEYATDENGDNITSKTGRLVTLKGTADQIDKAQAVTIKYFNEYTKIRKDLKEDKIKKGKGNKPLSATDANEI